MNTKMKLPLLKNNSGKLISSLTFVLCILRQGIKPGIGFKFVVLLLAYINWIQPVKAEGSRNLYPNGILGSRAHLEWRTSSWGPGNATNLRRRTLLQVYAKAGERILVGSSSMGVGLANILIYNSKGGRIGAETFSGQVFQCLGQPGDPGKILNRTQELAGPFSTTNTTGYTPCSYTVPTGGTGIYYVVFLPPVGDNQDTNNNPLGSIDFTSQDASDLSNITAWDVTVRETGSDVDINGRLFADYLSLFTGGNDRPINSTFYIVTKDGFHYQTDLKGLDPNGFVMYGNDIGFYDSDGVTPLYHNLFATGNVTNGTMNTVDGGTSLALPSHKIFFSNPGGSLGASDSKAALGIPLAPILPEILSSSFTGEVLGNTTKLNQGGDFIFETTTPGTYYIVIDQNISDPDYDANKSTNRLLRGRMTSAGIQTVEWDGKDNSGNFFPLGTNYPFKTVIGAGEYHFPMIDAESSVSGGPQFTILNAINAEGGPNRGFYDDRGYRTIGETNVQTPGAILCSGPNTGLVPNPAFSDPLVGFDTSTTNRAFGGGTNVNTNVGCTGSFGDAKGLDLWTYVSSPAIIRDLNIISVSELLMVKRITAINGAPINQYVDDPGSDHDDNTNNWPTPLNIYLRGRIDGGTVKPGDEIEYTIYFLSSGETPVTNVNFCDLVPENTTFLPTSFNGNIVNSTDRDGGLTTADYGMMLQIGSTTPTIKYLSNIVDSPDRGQYLTPGTAIPTTFTCPPSNTNGAVLVKIVSKTTPPSTPALPGETLPNATAPGVPANSYGFIRFRALVK